METGAAAQATLSNTIVWLDTRALAALDAQQYATFPIAIINEIDDNLVRVSPR